MHHHPSRLIASALLPFTAALALAGCVGNPAHSDAAAQTAAHAASVTARIAPTDAQGTVAGSLKFTKTSHGVQVSGNVNGLQPGSWHAFHVHEKGSCADKGNAARGHFNPLGMPHGRHGTGPHHVGDMPPLYADAKGIATVDFTSQSLALSGPNSIVGKAVIVHANDDDFNAQPTGNAGARIGCGIVQ